MDINLNLVQTLGLSVVVLLFGRFVVNKINVLNKFCIPAPVVGGLIFALITLFAQQTNLFTLTLDSVLKDFFMICFFTTVGFGASIKLLKKGGIAVVIFLVISTLLAILQDVLGVSLAQLFGLNPLIGLAVGSIPMTGGHATSFAFGPILEEAGANAANTVAVASATFGLMMGSLIGGPLAKRLIENYKLKQSDENLDQTEVKESGHRILSGENISSAFFQISIAVALGSIVSMLIAKTGFTTPAYVGPMLVAATMRNLLTDGSKFEIKLPEATALGEVFLSIFLAQALMTLKLWELAELAIPMIIMLLGQTLLVFMYARYITYFVMGKDYDAAVISAGHCGFAMGATPNAIANMNAVVKKYFPSPKAFFVLPLVGGLFIDLINTLIITTFMNFF